MTGAGFALLSAEPVTGPAPGTTTEGSVFLKQGAPGAFLGTNTGEFLDPEVAYVLSARAEDGNTIALRWMIADGYYLYRDKFKFALAETAGVTLESVAIPRGAVKEDPYFGRVEVFYKEARVTLKLRRPAAGPRTANLEVGYQGCAEAGLCYPPITKKVPLALPASVRTGKAR